LLRVILVTLSILEVSVLVQLGVGLAFKKLDLHLHLLHLGLLLLLSVGSSDNKRLVKNKNYLPYFLLLLLSVHPHYIID
jgi:hypothetical protein